VTTNIRNDLAEMIREVDGGNSLDPTSLGIKLFARLFAGAYDSKRFDDFLAFVARINPDKTMAASALADAIVDEFNLDQEA
jgi:hypothetical protein